MFQQFHVDPTKIKNLNLCKKNFKNLKTKKLYGKRLGQIICSSVGINEKEFIKK